ncbi:hypothetical protein B0H12DRAFT_1098213 [Mycena haematopus]|nr:hypothetical protein B0H12DRAFT_1098213 [Mycena haematopus]
MSHLLDYAYAHGLHFPSGSLPQRNPNPPQADYDEFSGDDPILLSPSSESRKKEHPIVVDGDIEIEIEAHLSPKSAPPVQEKRTPAARSESKIQAVQPKSEKEARTPAARSESKTQVIQPKGESSTAATSANFRRHETLWFNDGSLFLQLAGVRFKMHRSRLRRASTFLEQLFAIREESYEKASMHIALKSGKHVPVEEVAGLDLYILDGVAVKFADFEVLMFIVDNGIEYAYAGCGSQVQVRTPTVSMLASAIRAAKALQCQSIHSWAISSIQETWTWTPKTVFRERLSMTDAFEILVLVRTHKMADTVSTRALYELLRSPRFNNIKDIHLPIPRKRLNVERGKLQEAWISIAADAEPSAVPCPSVPPASDSSSSANDASLAEIQQCISHSPSDVRDIHMKVVHTSVFDQHLSDPLGGLDALIATPEVWSAEGYCPGCIYLRTKLWEEKKDNLMKELNGIWAQSLKKHW